MVVLRSSPMCIRVVPWVVVWRDVCFKPSDHCPLLRKLYRTIMNESENSARHSWVNKNNKYITMCWQLLQYKDIMPNNMQYNQNKTSKLMLQLGFYGTWCYAIHTHVLYHQVKSRLLKCAREWHSSPLVEQAITSHLQMVEIAHSFAGGMYIR